MNQPNRNSAQANNVYCLSGQGSNYYQMGKVLFAQNNDFTKWMYIIDEIFRPEIGESVLATLYDEGKKVGDAFSKTLYTHPAIFMVEYSMYKFLEGKGIYPDCVFGFSLGEFAASAIAGVVTFEDAAKMVAKHAALIESRCQTGGMLAILHSHDLYGQIASDIGGIALASINSAGHFVVSGPAERLSDLSRALNSRSIVNQFLPVSHAFHSSLIDSAGPEFLTYLKQFTFKAPILPYVSCERAAFITNGQSFADGYFWHVTRNPIQIKSAIECLESNGAYNYIDIGPSGTVINFLRMNLSEYSSSRLFAGFTPFGGGLANIERIVAGLGDPAFSPTLA